MAKYTAKQYRRFAAIRNAAKTAEGAPVVAKSETVKSETSEPKVREPVALDLTVESFEERSGPKAGAFGYAKVAYMSPKGEPKTGATATLFGDVYAALKDMLVPGATLKVLANIRGPINVVGIAA